MTSRRLRRALRRQWWVVVAAVLLPLVIVWLRPLSGPPLASATSVVLITPDPAALRRLPDSIGVATYQSFQAKQESLSARPIVERAVDLMQDRTEFRHPLFRRGESVKQLAELQRYYRDKNAERSTDELVSELAAGVRTQHVRRAQLVRVTVSHEDPVVALFGSWAIAEAAEQFHAERLLIPTHTFRERLVHRIREIETELDAVRSQSRDRAEPQRLGRSTALSVALQDLTRERDRLQGEIELQERRGVADAEPPRVGASDHGAERELDRARQRLVEAEAAKRELALTYRSDDLRVRAADELVTRLRDRVRELEAEVVRVRASRDRRVASRELVELRARRDSIVSLIDQFGREHSAVVASRSSEAPIALEILRLESLLRQLRGLVVRYETVGMWSSSTVTPFELASTVRSTEDPPDFWLALRMILLALALGGVAIVYLESCDVRVLDRERIGRLHSAPVLAELPSIVGEDPALSDEFRAALSPAVAVIDRARREGLRTLLVAGPRPGEGRTTVARGLVSLVEGRGDQAEHVVVGEHEFATGEGDVLRVVDSPPLGVSGAALDRGAIDAAVLVLDPERTTRESIVHAIDLLKIARIPVIGFIFNSA